MYRVASIRTALRRTSCALTIRSARWRRFAGSASISGRKLKWAAMCRSRSSSRNSTRYLLAWASAKPGISRFPARNLIGVCGAMEFIEATKLRSFAEVRVGRRIALHRGREHSDRRSDSCEAAGSESVHLIYRRGEKEMPAFRYEYDLAKLDGANFSLVDSAGATMGKGGRVCDQMRADAARTRERPRTWQGRAGPGQRKFEIAVDMVVRAIGQKPVTDLFRAVPGIEVRDKGTIAISDQYQTGAPKYFAGGDCTNGGKEVVDAVADGKSAARGIDAWLGRPRARN